MTATGKPEGKDAKVQKIGWDEADWRRIEEIAERLTHETHLDVNPTDAVRTAVRRLHDSLFAGQPSAESMV